MIRNLSDFGYDRDVEMPKMADLSFEQGRMGIDYQCIGIKMDLSSEYPNQQNITQLQDLPNAIIGSVRDLVAA
jgi:hypothetical protein